jgi:PhnB protein
MLAYEDGLAAMDWLARAFGFRETMRMLTKDGLLSQGEMEAGDGGVIMVANPTPDYQSPKHHRESCEAAAAWSKVPYIIDGVLVYVDDVDAHSRQAKAAGATILSGVETSQFGKRYRAEDLEGHRWMFTER